MGAVGSKVERATAEIGRVFSPSSRNRATRRNTALENRRARWNSRKRGVSNAVGRVGKGAYNAVGRVGKFAKNLGMGIFDVGRRVVKGVSRRAGNVVNYARHGKVRSYANRHKSAEARALYKKSKLQLKNTIYTDTMNLSPASLARKYPSVFAKRSGSAKSTGRSSLSSASKRSASAKKGVKWWNESTRTRGSAAGVGLLNSSRSSGNRSRRSGRHELDLLLEPSPKKVNYSSRKQTAASSTTRRNLSPGELRRRRLARFEPQAVQPSEAARNLSPGELRRRRLARFAP